MRTLSNSFTKYLMYFVFSIFAVGFTSCSNDDDVDDVIIEPDPDPTGSITVEDQTISGNTIVVQSVTVGQDSWIVARNAGEENDEGIVSEAVHLEGPATHTNVELPLLTTANLTGEEGGDDIVVMLHRDEGTSGTFEYDAATDPDSPIQDDTGANVSETVNVMGPSLLANNQMATENNEVIFSSVNTGGNGWIALYGENEDGTVNEDVILGSQYVEAGTWEDVTVAFDDPDFDYSGYNIHPRLYHDDPADQEFTYTPGGTEDLPETYRFDTTTGEGMYVGNTSETGGFTIQ